MCDGPEVTLYTFPFTSVCVLGVGCCSVCLKLFSCSLQLQRLGCWQVRSPAASHVCPDGDVLLFNSIKGSGLLLSECMSVFL